jgi:hypothetical protein
LNKNVEHTINHRGQARLNEYAPIVIMTGFQAENPLEEIFLCPAKETFNNVAMDNRTIGSFVEELQKALTNMHKIIYAANKQPEAEEEREAKSKEEIA